MTRLIASSGTEEAMIKTIARFYYGSTITLHETAPGTFDVHNKKGRITAVRVILLKGRYRFEDTAPLQPTCECGTVAILGNQCSDCYKASQEPEFLSVDTGEDLPQLTFAPAPDQQLRLI